MPVYTYETPSGSRFELRQSMRDTPLATHPETGEPVRRVITGGMGFFTARAAKPLSKPTPKAAAAPAPSNCCPTCHD
jgi:putative FmdB family regulatory protein